jgi:hypothetical protein
VTDVSIRPITIGSSRTPEMIAETPNTYCSKVGRKVSAPSIAKPTMKLSAQQVVNTRSLNSRSGSTGSAPGTR